MISRWKKDILEVIKNPIQENNIIKFVKDGKLHNIEFPALIEYYPYEIKDGIIGINNNDEPVIKTNKIIKRIEYYIYGKRHRDNGPAMIWYYYNGNIYYEGYFINNYPKPIINKKYVSIYYYENSKIMSIHY